MPNSATLVQALLAAFCAILCALSGMGGGSMMLGARTAAWAKSGGGWVNPYVTDGLVAMWDGEWNAGGGVHDPNATVWKDLANNGFDVRTDFNEYTTGVFSEDALVTDRYCAAYGNDPLPYNENGSISVCLEFPDYLPDDFQSACFLGGGRKLNYSQNACIIFNWRQYNRCGATFSNPDCTLYNITKFGSFVLPKKMTITSSSRSLSINSEDFSSYETSTASGFVGASFKGITFGCFPVAGYVDDIPSNKISNYLPKGTKIHRVSVFSRLLSDAEKSLIFSIDNSRFNMT